MATSACTTRYETTPTTAAEVRAASREVKENGVGHVRGGKVDTYSNVHASAYEGTLADVSEKCGKGPCPLDDASATGWTIQTSHRTVDATALFGYSLLGGFVALNVRCFAADACSTPLKTTVGVTDVVVGVGAVALLVALAVAFRNFRGD